ncbi:ComEC/Rec2 family competence protein [Patescibacteria group bacterium]
MRYLVWFFVFIFLAIRIFVYFESIPSYSGGTVIRIKDTVRSEPLRFKKSQYLRLKGYKIYLPKYPEINYGDEVIIKGVVDKDSLKKAELIKVNETTKILIKLRSRLIDFFQKSLPFRHASLVSGVVMGSKQGLDMQFWEKLKNTGTVHVVVASGMNVTIVAKFLITLLAIVLPRRKAIPFALVGIWSYSILSGFDAPIVRASIMGSLAFIAQELGRLYYAGRTLLITAVLMVLIKPEWIIDLGFILSFVATASILLIEEPINSFFKKVPSFLRSDLSATLSAQIGVAPILYASFGQFNLLSPIYNIAVLWTIPIITLIGMISGITSLVFVPLGQLILYLAYPFTSWFIFCTTFI